MKIVVIFLIFITIVTASEWKPKHGKDILSIRDACIIESHLTNEQFNSMKNFTLVDEVPVHTYLGCVAEKLGILDDGKLNVDRVVEQYKMDLDVNLVKNMVEQCINANSSDKSSGTDERIYKFYVCLFETEIGTKIKDAVKQKLPQKV